MEAQRSMEVHYIETQSKRRKKEKKPSPILRVRGNFSFLR